MFNRQDAKSYLTGIDFGRLEQNALQMIAQGKPISVSVSSPTAYKDQMDLYSSMLATINGNKAQVLWGDDLYTPPKPHCMSKVHAIIDSFWSAPALGLYGQYIAQLDKKPKTKDVFKGKSTTHHYPWYRRGSKY